ncbi:MAG: hypothetical protein HMLIMOIP_001284 [Candidatus Nitrosomirales archaeon]|jgi:hypothetical protein
MKLHHISHIHLGLLGFLLGGLAAAPFANSQSAIAQFVIIDFDMELTTKADVNFVNEEHMATATESPIGIIALNGSSFAALGGFLFWRRRQGNNRPHALAHLGI